MKKKTTPKITSWKDVAPGDLQGIKGVCLDIDETLSTQGKLTAEAYSALWDLKNAGLWVIPITGRPAGWCDQISRFWPVDAVVGENGAFTFFMQDGMRMRSDTPCDLSPEEAREELLALSQQIIKHFPETCWASDQRYREYDLAVDFCEDVPAWPKNRVKALVDLCESQGAHAKISSIHVNTWFGDYNKRVGFEYGLKAALNKDLDLKEWIFIGDSPNDEPLFEYFRYSVGVANVKPFLPMMKSPPRWVTEKESGAGFCEMAEKLILAVSAPARKSKR